MRIDCDTTMPPSEMTATSLVPPPMSTTMLPVGSPTGRPAPNAPALRSPLGGPRPPPPHKAPPPPRRQARLLDRALLHAGHARGHAHHDARMRPAVLVHLLDEVAQHLLR